MSKVKISVIIPTYNRSKYLVNTIGSLKEQSFFNYEIIVVDNACLEDTKSLVNEEIKNTNTGKCSIRYIQESNMGLHNARHTGAKGAMGKILLYIDDDVIVSKSLLREIVNSYQDIEVGCIGGKILPKWDIEPPWWVNIFPKEYLSILDKEEKSMEGQWIYGCNFSIRKDLLFKVGGFNPDAFNDKKMWFLRGDGEIGLLRKVRNAGKKVIYNPKAIVWHFIPKERLTIDYFKERAFKSGVEASFTKYHYDNKAFNPFKIFARGLFFCICYIFLKLLASIPIRRHIKYRVNALYYKARCLYEFRLAIDQELQKFVRKESYLI